MAVISNIKNKTGGVIYPITQAKAVYMDDDKTVQNAVSELNGSLTQIDRSVDELNSNLEQIKKWTIIGLLRKGESKRVDLSIYSEVLLVLFDSTRSVSRTAGTYPIEYFMGGNNVGLETYVDSRHYATVEIVNLNTINIINIVGTYADSVLVYAK